MMRPRYRTWNSKKITVIVLILVFAAMTLLPTAALAQGKIMMGWQWTNDGLSDTYIAQLNKTRHLDVISPTGIYVVSGSGKLENRVNSKLVQYAHEKGMQVWALFTVEDFNKEIARQILNNIQIQDGVIAEVVAWAVKYNFDGINLDWEGMRSEDRDQYTRFVKELTKQLHAQGKVVSLNVVGTTNNYQNVFSNPWSYCIDREALASVVDYVALMGYDEHTEYNPSGSVSSLPWVENAVKYLLNYVPAEKVILGVPFYTHDISKSSYKYLTLSQMSNRIAQYGASVTWDASIGQNVAKYITGGVAHTIWVEDERSMALRMDLVNKYNLAGMAAWKIGSESSAMWELIAGKLGKNGAAETVIPVPAPPEQPDPQPTAPEETAPAAQTPEVPAPPALLDPADGAITINVNGTPVSADVPPYIDTNSRTMVPIRFISEALGAEVDWNETARIVTITKGETMLHLIIDQKGYLLGGALKTMDTSAVIRDGRTMVPLRLVSEGLGALVEWLDATRTVNVTT